jgi:hypothetical protein
MKDWKPMLLSILATVSVFSLAIIAANCSYGQLELRAFNRINGTHYTMDEWRIYEYEIKKLHPFKDPQDDN